MAGPRWQAVAALVDPLRRSLYDYVRRQDHPVTREEAAHAQAISRNLTAFHLDKLVEADLLTARYEAPAGQPRGRGRTPKVYEPTGDGVSLTLPPRRYEIVGHILADAVAEHPANAAEAARRIAFEHGYAIGQQSPTSAPCRDDEVAAATATLADLGFEPHTDRPSGSAAMVSLRNCPFHRLAARQPELVCGLNQAFVRGVLAGLGVRHLTAALVPTPGTCCVHVRAET